MLERRRSLLLLRVSARWRFPVPRWRGGRRGGAAAVHARRTGIPPPRAATGRRSARHGRARSGVARHDHGEPSLAAATRSPRAAAATHVAAAPDAVAVARSRTARTGTSEDRRPPRAHRWRLPGAASRHRCRSTHARPPRRRAIPSGSAAGSGADAGFPAAKRAVALPSLNQPSRNLVPSLQETILRGEGSGTLSSARCQYRRAARGRLGNSLVAPGIERGLPGTSGG